MFISNLSEIKFEIWRVTTKKLEPVFVKHYAPNICLSIDMAKLAVS